MFCRTLLPEDAKLTPVGGPGKRFRAAGQNWDIVSDGLTEDNLAMMGQWRVGIAPGAARKKDFFLHVIQVGDQNLAQMDKTELLRSSDTCGVRLTAAGQTWEVVFNINGPLGGHIRRTDTESFDRALTTAVQPQHGI